MDEFEETIFNGVATLYYEVTGVGEVRLQNSIVTIDGRVDERTLVVVGVDALVGATFEQDPEALLDYRFDFASWLSPGETLVEAPYFHISPGINLRARFLNQTNVVVWVEGGQPDGKYVVQATVPTSEGKVLVGKIAIKVTHK